MLQYLLQSTKHTLDVILSRGNFIDSSKITFQVRIFIMHVLVMWYYKRTKKSMIKKIHPLNSEILKII